MSYRDKMRDEVVAILKRIVKHVELAANGDNAMLQDSGFEISQKKPSEIRYSHPLPATVLTMIYGQSAASW